MARPSRAAARIRADTIAGQVAVAVDGATQDEWFAIHGMGPDSFERTALFIDERVPLADHDVIRPLGANSNSFAESYIRSYLRWFDTRRIQIVPYSGAIGATQIHWRAPGSRRASAFPSRELIIVNRLRHLPVACLSRDMRADTQYDIRFFRSTDERFWCTHVWPDVQRILEGERIWRTTVDVDLASWEGFYHERAFNNPFRFGRDFDTEVRVRQRHRLFTGYHNTEFWEVPSTIRSLLHPWLSDDELGREVSRVLLVPTSRTYVYFGRYFCHIDHTRHFIRRMQAPFGNAHVREQLGILAETERCRDTFSSFLSRAFHGVPYLELHDPALTCDWGRFVGVIAPLPEWALDWADTNAAAVLTGSGVPYHLTRLALGRARSVDWSQYDGDTHFLDLTGPFFRYDPYTGELDDLPARRGGERQGVELVGSRVRFLGGVTVSHLRSLVDETNYVLDQPFKDLVSDDLPVDRSVLRDNLAPGPQREYRDFPFGRDWLGTNSGGDGLLVIDDVVPPPVPPAERSPSAPPTQDPVPVAAGVLLSLPTLGQRSSIIPTSAVVSSVDRARIESEHRQVLNKAILVPMRASLVPHNFVPVGQTSESSLPNLEWIPRIYDQLLEAFTGAYRDGSATREELVALQSSHDSLRSRAQALELSSADSGVTISRLEGEAARLGNERRVLQDNVSTLQSGNAKLREEVASLQSLERSNVDLARRLQESTRRNASLSRDLLAANALVDASKETIQTTRNGYRVAFRAMSRQGEAFYARLQQTVNENLQAFANDVSVERVAAACQDPGLVDFVRNEFPEQHPGAGPSSGT